MKSLLLALLLAGSACANPVTSFEGGTTSTMTEKFRVDGPWKLSWQFEGTALRVEIFSDKAGASANPIRQAGSGSGSMDIEKPGTYWLHIKSVGDYHIDIDSREAAAAPSLPVFEGNLERKGTSVFTAPAGWGFRYSGQGVLKVTLYDERRNPVGSPVALLGGGTGERKVGTPGKYFFMIQSTGPYRIEIFK